MTELLERRWCNPHPENWGEGPWDDEPDKLQWVDEVTGYDCLIVRHPTMGHLCGYVGVPPGHPCAGYEYDNLKDVEAHGGLTYTGGGYQGDTDATGISHVVFPDRPPSVWWIGFDCAHAGDLSPGMRELRMELRQVPELAKWDEHREPFETYRDLLYVKTECTYLAAQLTTAEPKGYKDSEP